MRSDPRGSVSPLPDPQNLVQSRSAPGFPRELLLMTVVVATAALILAAAILLTPPAPPALDTGPTGPHGVTVGNPILGICGQGTPSQAPSCLSGDYLYTLTVESSTEEFENVAFRVQTASSSVYSASGGEPGFAILNSNGTIAAAWSSMNGSLFMAASDWNYSDGVAPSTPMTNLFSIVVDMGRADPMGQGYTFVLIGTGSYSGTSSPLSLP
jgi:hypothetical protein